ncbi:MAG: long-chain N-acyl amino acid synthase [Pirellulales bacterium]|nr:long-chain N-acyl amino acid synthase [Pirellulales bacterium]
MSTASLDVPARLLERPHSIEPHPAGWIARRRTEGRLAPRVRVGGAEGPEEAVLKIASTRAELFDAFALVYDAYIQRGLMEPNPFGMRITPYHLLPTTEVLVATVRQSVVCTMTLVGDGEMGLPMESVYENEVLWRRMQGSRVGEVSCLADRPGKSGNSCRLAVELMRLMAQSAKRRGLDELLIAVHPRHAKFYERCAAFQIIGEQKEYHSVCDNPAVALALDLHRSAVTHPKLYQKFFGTFYPDEVLRHRPLPESLREEMSFIVQETGGFAPDYQHQMALITA